MLIIRNERPDDYRAVEELTKLAFWNVNVPGCDEHYVVHILRSHEDFIPELDFVAELDGELIASIMYTRSKLCGVDGTVKPVITFGPFSVLPEYQRHGYGKALLEHSLERAAGLGYDAVVIFGNPENYIPRGFKSCKKFNVALSEGFYPVALLVLELKKGALDGNDWIFEESAAFKFDQAAADEFDKDFPQLEKGFRSSQELFYIYSRSGVIR